MSMSGAEIARELLLSDFMEALTAFGFPAEHALAAGELAVKTVDEYIAKSIASNSN
jgi:hypothetical protein